MKTIFLYEFHDLTTSRLSDLACFEIALFSNGLLSSDKTQTRFDALLGVMGVIWEKEDGARAASAELSSPSCAETIPLE